MPRMELFCNNTLFSSLISLNTQCNFVYLLSLSAFEYSMELGSSSFLFFWLHKCIMLWRFFGWRTWHFHYALHMSSTSTSRVTCMFTIWHCVHAACFLWMHNAHDTPWFWLLYFLCKHLIVCTMDTHFHFNNFVFFEYLTMCIIYNFLC
jgi:hypothetical protein